MIMLGLKDLMVSPCLAPGFVEGEHYGWAGAPDIVVIQRTNSIRRFKNL